MMKLSKNGETANMIEIGPGRKRRFLHTDKLMMVVIDFEDGPAAKPDNPHAHPHEQVTYVAEGEVLFFIGTDSRRLSPGDMVAVPPDQPHRVQTMTPHVRLIDTFTPIRQDFL
jgi:quercetin dioxygenase-like cupin family protein